MASCFNMRVGESPNLEIDPAAADAWWGRNPFEVKVVAGLSDRVMISSVGAVSGHNVVRDTTIYDALRVDPDVPVSPLFVRDLAGRVVYIGFGPERKTNEDWAAYRPPFTADGSVAPKDFNPFAPVCVFPRYCRDVEKMGGKDLLEQVFLTKFRCVEAGLGYYGIPSGFEDGDDTVAATYAGANLYPYKLRLDTYYTDGWKLPQTQMLYARGANVGVDVAAARALGEKLVSDWQARAPGTDYEAWMEKLGGEREIGRLYGLGCTVIPTFEAGNGFNVVGRNFELEDYWPGRAVLGLHDVVEQRRDKAPEGTILEVLSPGYVTADHIARAQVAVSDGSGYVSPNAGDPVPFAPNINLPHTRSIDDWRATWIPTHPEHFEAPALWGWELASGRFMQMVGPLWDPLHYYYASVDEVLKAYEQPLSQEQNRWLVPVPEHMHNRFYPVVPMVGFDTISATEKQRRRAANILPMSAIQRVNSGKESAGIGYHPLPAEFEFEVETFWFPDLHPLNRDQGICPEDVMVRIIPVISPRVTVTEYAASVDAPESAPWLKDEETLMTPDAEVFRNYPFLARYLVDDMTLEESIRMCPLPFLTDVGEVLGKPAPQWWADEGEAPLDGPAAIAELAPGTYDALWDMRQRGVEMVQFRHMMYREYLPLYMVTWWTGSTLLQAQSLVAQWELDSRAENEQLMELLQGRAQATLGVSEEERA